MTLSQSLRTAHPGKTSLTEVFVLTFVLTGLLAPSQLAADEVSRQPPPIFAQKLNALLTPLDEVLRAQRSQKPPPAAEHRVSLLEEEVDYVEESGRRYSIFHTIRKALDTAGAKGLAEYVHTFSRANQKVHLALAQTILPDGVRIPVQPSAAILQSIQQEADVYDDQGQLRLIFASAKPGAIMETVIVVEENQFFIPGELTDWFSWGTWYPIQKIHYVYDLPAALAQRLKITNIGEVIPAPVRIEPAPGRVRLTWTGEAIQSLPDEPNGPPVAQSGPSFRLTTLPDWNAFARWYAPLLAGRATLKPALAKQVDDWTKGARTPEETLAILFSKAANDVRYVGLEFGISGHQPHDPNTVWENQYGDCKDKANLLRTMLRHKGIDSWIVLLNTQREGRIHRDSPSSQFTHAILAVELAKGRVVYCDPTITHGKPGLLAPHDVDREVLLIKDNTAEWARTPFQEAGDVRYDLDLKLDAERQISGWLTLEETGYWGTNGAIQYGRVDAAALTEKAANLVRGFFRGAEIVDVSGTPLDKWDGRYRLKLYFTASLAKPEKENTQALPFPKASFLFVDPGSEKHRKTPYWGCADLVSVTARIQLPEGFKPATLPQPLKLESPSIDIVANWTVNGRECRASLDSHTKKYLLRPDHFEVLFSSLNSANSWFNRPLVFSAPETKPNPAPEPKVTADNFPKMLTAQGQLNLVEKRFPSQRNPGLRREALRKVIEYFPADRPILFEAGMHLAIIDWEAGNTTAAEAEIRRLLKLHRDSITAENAAWGEYILARILTDVMKGAATEAEQLLAGIGKAENLSAYRRSWADYQRAVLIQDKSRQSALKLLRESLTLNGEAQPSQFVLMAKLLVLEGRMADLQHEIDELVTKKPHGFAEMLTALAEGMVTLLPPEKATERETLLRILADAGTAADLDKHYGEILNASRASIRAATAASSIRDALKAHLAQHPPAKLDAATDALRTRAEFERTLEKADKDDQPDRYLRCALELLTRFEPDGDFPLVLWKAACRANAVERVSGKTEPLLPVLIDFCDRLPDDSDYFFEGRFLRGEVCVRRGETAAGRKIFEGLVNDRKLPECFKLSAYVRLGDALELQGNYPAAIDAYLHIESYLQYPKAKTGLLHAALLNLDAGKRNEALRLIHLLATANENSIDEATAGWQIEELIRLTRVPAKASAFWDASTKWWPDWLAIEKKAGLKLGRDEIVPVIGGNASFDADLDKAIADKDATGFLKKLSTIAHGARWEPHLAIHLARLAALHGAEVAPALAADLKTFSLSLFERFSLQPGDSFSEEMARLWGDAAKQGKTEAAAAIATLEKVLAGPGKLVDRPKTVILLCDLYHKVNHTQDEESLLKRETANPDTKSDTAESKEIAARYERISKEGAQSRQLSQALNRWFPKHKPAWFDYAEPKSLDDPRLSDLQAVLSNPGRTFNDTETTKLQLLVALSPAQPFERRAEHIVNAACSLLELSFTKDQARELLESIFSDPDFPESIRVEALWQMIGYARLEENAACFEKLRTHPLVSRFSDRSKASCELMHDALAVDRSSPEAISGFCERLLDNELNWASLRELRRSFLRLLELNRVDLAEKIVNRLANPKLAQEQETRRASLRMDYLKMLTRAKRWLPAAVAMRDTVLARFPIDTIHEPAGYARLHDTRSLDGLDHREAFEVSLWRIARREVDPTAIQFWKVFATDLRECKIEGAEELIPKLFAAALKNTSDDETLAQIVDAAWDSGDVDDAAFWTRFTDMVKPFRDGSRFPVCHAAIRKYEIYTGWRHGEIADPQRELASLDSPDCVPFVNRTRLRYYIQTKNVPRLRSHLEGLNSDELLSDFMIDSSLRGLELAGMKDELAMAADTAKKTLYRSVLQAWAKRDALEAVHACEIAQSLHNPAAIPQDWAADLSTRGGRQSDRLMLAIEDGVLRKDWPKALTAANEAIQLSPTAYHLYWQKANALIHLGKTQEAQEPLHVFVKYCKDCLEYPEARELLKQIQRVEVKPL